MRSVKLIVLGDKDCGGTDLLLTYIRQQDTDMPHTARDHHTRTLLVDGNPVEVELFDVTPQSDYDLLRPLSFAHTDAFILCYSTDNRTSFEKITRKYVPEVRSHCPGCPYVVVGCRCSDTDSDSPKSSTQKSVVYEEGRAVADRLKAYAFCECSVEDPLEVNEVVAICVKAVFEASKGMKQNNRCVLL